MLSRILRHTLFEDQIHHVTVVGEVMHTLNLSYPKRTECRCDSLMYRDE
jgi:hypothetical protein